MYSEVYQILDALINMISIKYPMELATEWMTCFAKGLENLQCIRYGHPKTITLQWSLENFVQILYFTFLLYVSNSLLAMNIPHSIFIEWVGHGKVCVAWMKIIWPTSKGDMQAIRQQKATSHELGLIVKFKVKFKVMLWAIMLLWTKFASYSRVQLPSSGDIVINPI